MGGADTLNWTDANNWSNHAAPGAQYDASISIPVSGAISIASGAQSIDSLTDTGGDLYLSGGSLTIAANSIVSRNLTVTGGTLTPNATLNINSATPTFSGGSIGGTDTLLNSALVIGPGLTGAGSFILLGSDTLTGNVAAGQTLWVQDSNAGGNATLTTVGNVTNDGTNLLQSINSNYAETLATGSNSFTNAADGTVQANAGTGGGRTINGTLVNREQIAVGSAVLTIGGTYKAAGGSISGPGYLFDCTLEVTASPAAPPTILIAGAGDTPATDNLPNTTIWVQGNAAFGGNGNASLTVADGVSNAGTILLQSATSSFSTCQLVASSTFTNAATNTILVNNGAGGVRTISGTIINAGLVSIAGVAFTVTGNSFTNQVGGLVSGHGTFNTSGVTLVNNGIIDITSPPSIFGVLVGRSAISVTFYSAVGMDATTVTNPANYTILGSGGDGIFGNGNDVNLDGSISSITYDGTNGRSS
jgi:hypothetical protein